MNYEQEINELQEQFGVMDSEKLIEKIKLIVKNPLVESSIKSNGLCLIGSIICYLSPHLEDDNGYSYFKKALAFNEDNYDAILGICSIFDTYPYPFNSIVTEVEYLSYIRKLVEKFEYLEERQKFNVLQSIKSYSSYRTKVIEKYGYPIKLNK